MILLHAAFVVLASVAIVWACRWVFTISRTLGWIVCLGVVLRAATGFGFLAISFWNAPLLRGLHTGDGFWALAPDARVYYDFAARVGNGSPLSILSDAPSPFFLVALGLWFRASGATLASAILFNLVCYVGTAAVVVSALRDASAEGPQELLSAVVSASFAFSPILLLTSTQVLKDPFFIFLVVLACASAIKMFNLLRSPLPAFRCVLGWLGAVCVALYGVSGIRGYYSIFVWMAYAGGSLALVCVSPATMRLRNFVCGLAVLSLLWVTFMVGAGSYYQGYTDMAKRFVGFGVGDDRRSGMFSFEPDFEFFGATMFSLRSGFVRSGGRTNLAGRSSVEQIGASALDVLRDVAVGCSAILVPISALQALSVVRLSGGQGFLSVTDLDTLFLDVMLVAAWVLIYRDRARLMVGAPGGVFLAVLAVVTGLLLAYVVTNFGTLFRLRLLTIVPAWIMPLALEKRQGETPAR